MLKKTFFVGQRALLTCAVLIGVFGAVGCSSSSNPVGGDEGDKQEIIRTPASVRITEIEVTAFKNKDWDNEIIKAWRKADIFVTLGVKGKKVSYTSDVRENVSSGSYNFSKTGVLFGKELPMQFSYSSNLQVTLYDKDVFSDELMASINFSPSQFFTKDATGFVGTVAGKNSVKIKIKGEFKY